jgi:formylglycine-generating enzyme required for sulfatase activity
MSKERWFHEKYMDIIEFESPTINEKGEILTWTHHSAERFTENLGNGVDLSMVIIPAGIFHMGSTPHYGNDDERPQHLVTIKSFVMGEHPVTQAQWKAVMGKLPPCRFKGDRLPVERVSWDDARKFCQRLSKTTKRNYDLPSEAQWEHACRAGTTSPFSFGETLTTDIANFNGEHNVWKCMGMVCRQLAGGLLFCSSRWKRIST